MRNKTKLLGILFAVMLFFVIAPTQNAHAASVTKSNWYKTVLNSKTAKYKVGTKTYKRSSFKYYKLVDINQDGTKELLLSTTAKSYVAYNQKVLLLTYYKGKVKPLKVFTSDGGEELLYRKGKLALTQYTRLSDTAQIEVYKLKDGKLTKTVTVTNAKQEDNSWQGYKNGRQCSDGTVAYYWDKYYDQSTLLKYSKISSK